MDINMVAIKRDEKIGNCRWQRQGEGVIDKETRKYCTEGQCFRYRC
jgi:hypothetical protein